MKYEVYKDRGGEWRWLLIANNGRKIADSAEGYRNKDDCKAAISLVKASASAQVVETP